MGTRERKEREKEVRRQQILVAAKRIFSDKGFAKATMEDIAKEAELSLGTLYLYFKNKDELYVSHLLRILHYFIIRLEHINDDKNVSSEQKLDALIDVMIDVYNFDSLAIIDFFHLQSSETLKNLSPRLMSEIVGLSKKTHGAISDIFADGINKGVFINKHPVALGDTFWALFSGIILWETSKKMINEDKDYLMSTLKAAFEIFRRGIVKSRIKPPPS